MSSGPEVHCEETGRMATMGRYRNTPTTTTGQTPAELLLSWTPRTRLTMLQPDLERRMEEQFFKVKTQADGKRGSGRAYKEEESVLVQGLRTGGIRLENNPWVCDCQLLWLSRWLRRWLRETLRVQMLHFDAAIYVHNLARQSKCTYPEGQQRKPVIDLKEDDFQCTSFAGCIATPSRILTAAFVTVAFVSVGSP
ncbi:hypothetical protein HPB50_009223 [Hyalomma asiaticum]|uniref:Uncharacterized protein n=1 Tax=Hyalomma asiaticum TaxID=266040 RepID=A0ACB7T8R4_HYAAI|nr:hypothetical protein HPB50_009223 [Hyalomma asiaticum]